MAEEKIIPEQRVTPLLTKTDSVARDYDLGSLQSSQYAPESEALAKMLQNGDEIPLEYMNYLSSDVQDKVRKKIPIAPIDIGRQKRLYVITKRDEDAQRAKTPEEMKRQLDSFSGLYKDVFEYGLQNDRNFTTTEKQRKKDANRLDLTDNKDKIFRHFPELKEETFEKLVEDGNGDYSETWAYLKSGGNPQKELDWVDYVKSSHVADDGSTKIPFIGSLFGINNMWKLQQSVERLDLATGAEEIYNETSKKDLARVINFLDAMAIDKTTGYKLLGSLNQFAELVLLRSSAKGPITARGKKANMAVGNSMKATLRKISSKKFLEKLSSFSKTSPISAKIPKVLAQELKVATSLKGTAFMTLEEAETMKSSDMTTFVKTDLETEDGDTWVVDIDFENPDEGWTYLSSAIGNTAINALSERTGGLLKAFAPGIPKKKLWGKIANGALVRSIITKNPKANPSLIKKALDNANVDSIFSEILEERVASVAVGVAGVDQIGSKRKPLFKIEDEDGEFKTEIGEILIPTAEDFFIEVATIVLGSGAGQVGQYYQNKNALGSHVISPGADKDQINSVASNLVKQFTNNRKGKPGPLDAILWRATLFNERLDGRRSIKYLPEKSTDPKYIKKLRERGSEMLTKDLVNFLESNPELEDISFGWYGDNYTQAKEELSRGPLPELKDQNSEDYFSFLIAVTSPQSDPELNTKKAIRAFIQTERGRSDLPAGLSSNQQKNLIKYKKLKEHLGSHNEVAKFLTSKMTGKEMTKKLWEYGLLKENKGSLPNGILKDETAYVAEYFGPKVGAFYLNLMGIESIATVDMWMYRAISTALGEPIHNMSYTQIMKEYEKAKKAKVLKVDKKGKAVLDKDGKKQYTIGEALDLGSIKVPALDKNGKQKINKKTGKPVFKAIKLIESASQRKRLKLYREIVQEIQQDFNKATGKNWSVAQVQAGIWYMEKQIFTQNGVDGAKVGLSDYLSVAESIVNLREVYDEKTRRTIRTAKEADDEIGAEERRSELSRSTLPGKVSAETGADNPKEGSEEKPTDGLSVPVSGGDDEGSSEIESDIPPKNVRRDKLKLKKQIDKDALNKKDPNLLYKEVPEVVILDNETQAPTFFENLLKFKESSIWGGAVSLHDLEYYKNGKDDPEQPYIIGKPVLLQSYDGLAGSAIVPLTDRVTGETVVDIQSVFNTSLSQNKESFFTGTEMMRRSIVEAIKMQNRMGANKITLDCYDGFLPNFYKTFGFVETNRFDWNDEFAKPDFPTENYKKFFPSIKDGKPSIVEFEFNPAKSLADKNSLYSARLGLEQTARIEEESVSGYLRRKIQNKLSRAFDFKKGFEKSTGRPMMEDEDFATEMRLSPNKVIEKVNQVLDSLVNREGTGFYQRMAKDGITEDDLNLYLHALHTKERNLHVENITEGKGAVGSGLNVKGELMTNARAKEIIDYYETLVDGKPGKVIDYAKEFKIKYIQRAVQIMEQGGLIDREKADIFLNRNVGDAKARKKLKDNGVAIFSNYITLNVDMEADHTLGGMDLDKGTNGFSLNGPEGFAIKGSSTDLQRLNPVQQTIEALVQKITRAENNQVNMKLLKSMRAVDYETEVDGQVVKAIDVQERDPKDGSAFNDDLGHRVYTNTKNLQDNQILAKENGVEYIITINDPKLANAMKDISPMGTNFLIDGLNAMGNFTKMWITSWNPSFWIGNFQADFLGGVFNLSTQEGADMAIEVATSAPKAVSGIWTSLRDPEDHTNEWSVYYDRMKSAGGKVSFYDPKDYEDRFKDLDKRMKNLDKSGKEKQALKSVVNYIGDINDAIEGGIRLATFRSAVDRGYTDAESAIMARDVTIDFNSKGELGRWIEAGYRFANVGVQGVYRTGKAFKDNPKMASVIGTGLATTAYIMSEFNRSFDEEEWEDISDFEKDNYMFLPNLVEGKGFFRWRQPYGWGVFSTMGTIASEINDQHSKLTDEEGVDMSYFGGRFLKALGHNFVPIPTNQIPTLPLQVAQGLWKGEDAIGRKFRPHKYNPQSSNLETYYPSTPEWAKGFANIISNLPFPGNPNLPTGNYNSRTQQIEWKPQGIDISPNDIEYMFGQVFGGVFTDLNSIIKMNEDGTPSNAYKKILSDSNGTDWTKVPLVRKLLRYNPNRDNDQSRFYRLSRKGRTESLKIYELNTIQSSLNNLYYDNKINLKEYNKMWDRVYDNEADRISTASKLRKEVKDYKSEDLKNPKFSGISGPGIKKEPEFVGSKRGDLKETLDLLEKEKEFRKN
mgnify:CR=1 FL=1